MGQETTRFPLSSNTPLSSPKDSIASDSVIVANEGGVVEMIDYSSEDSIIFLLGEKKLELYGAGTLNYGNIRVSFSTDAFIVGKIFAGGMDATR